MQDFSWMNWRNSWKTSVTPSDVPAEIKMTLIITLCYYANTHNSICKQWTWAVHPLVEKLCRVLLAKYKLFPFQSLLTKASCQWLSINELPNSF
jgi:antibiotic biosynthesis monooxygenase (ABM) superfamily enzyme